MAQTVIEAKATGRTAAEWPRASPHPLC